MRSAHSGVRDRARAVPSAGSVSVLLQGSALGVQERDLRGDEPPSLAVEPLDAAIFGG
jgi:hypothetical protein